MLIEVTNSKTAKAFIDLPRKLYKDDPNWICPLDEDIEAVFDPSRNPYFSHGVCTRWIMVNEQQEPIGRVAAFVNHQKTVQDQHPTGGIGFFESIEEKETAFALFNGGRQWLQSAGMKAMDGPINFGENDKYWGLLVQGYKQPSYGMNYNPPHYTKFFEDYGFQKVYDQLTNTLDATVPLPDRFTKIADWVLRKPGYSFEHFSKEHKERYFRDFQDIYNDAWSNFDHFTPIELSTIRESFRQMQAIMDEKIIWFAYYNGEPIAFVLCLPDVNQVLKPLGGKLHLLNKLRFVWYRHTTTISRLRIIIMGCKKRFQNHGIESALIRCLQQEVLPRRTVKEVELAWVGDFNQKMMAIHQATGARTDKVHRTYRYHFPRE